METFGKKRSLKLDTRVRISFRDKCQSFFEPATDVAGGGAIVVAVGVGVAGDKMVSLKRSPHC